MVQYDTLATLYKLDKNGVSIQWANSLFDSSINETFNWRTDGVGVYSI